MRRTLALLLTFLLTASSQHNGTRVGFGCAPGWQDDGTQNISTMWVDDITVLSVQ